MSLKRTRALARLTRMRLALERDGLPAQPDLFHVAALTHALIEILGRRDDRRRASAAAEYLYRIAPRSFGASGIEPELACKRGCSYCCHGYVSASAPQIFAAANAVRAGTNSYQAAIARVTAVASRVGGLDVLSRVRLRLPCPLLVDDACSIYGQRPLACRGYASFSLAACQRSFNDNSAEVRVPPAYVNVRSALENALRAALKCAQLPTASYELTTALTQALERPDAEASWLAGQGVFEQADVDRSAAPGTEFQRELMLDTLIAVARGETPEYLHAHGPA